LGVIIIKRLSIIIFAILLTVVLSACGGDKQTGITQPDEGSTGSMTDNVQNDTVGSTPDISVTPENENGSPSENELPDSDDPSNDTTGGDNNTEKRELLQSASIDLDADGINEQVQAVKVTVSDPGSETAGRFEGRLVIIDGSERKEVVFSVKDEDLSGMMSGMQFEDMDGDGAKDVFITIPGYGASFTYSNCFVYSYAKDKSAVFISDNELADFIGRFRFAYESGNGSKLSIINDQYGFSASLSIEDSEYSAVSEEVMFIKACACDQWKESRDKDPAACIWYGNGEHDRRNRSLLQHRQ
jgi:hypothetical protein